jgi:hypothetical protein
LAYDKAGDDGAVHAFSHDESIHAIIQNRTFKLDEPEKVLGGRTPLNIVYDQAGTVLCYDKAGTTPVRHAMARTAVERVNGWLKIFRGIADGQVYGARRFHAHVAR